MCDQSEGEYQLMLAMSDLEDDGPSAAYNDAYDDDGNPLWTTREGKRIRMRDMTDAHLRNAIAMRERQGAHIGYEDYENLLAERDRRAKRLP